MTLSPFGIYGGIGQLGASAKAPVVPWYLAGGVSEANCKIAYKFVGVASKAAGMVNIVNPGTYDASDGGNYYTWSTDNGIRVGQQEAWKLATNYQPGANNTRTVILLLTGITFSAARYRLFSARNDFVYLEAAYDGTMMTWRNGNGSYSQAVTFSSGVVAVAGMSAYLNGSAVGTITGNSFNLGTSALGIGTYPGGYYAADFYAKAFAYYDTTLTAAQVSAISTAMAAL